MMSDRTDEAESDPAISPVNDQASSDPASLYITHHQLSDYESVMNDCLVDELQMLPDDDVKEDEEELELPSKNCLVDEFQMLPDGDVEEHEEELELPNKDCLVDELQMLPDDDVEEDEEELELPSKRKRGRPAGTTKTSDVRDVHTKRAKRILPTEMLTAAMCCSLLCLPSMSSELFAPARENFQTMTVGRQHQWLLDYFWSHSRYNMEKDKYEFIYVIGTTTVCAVAFQLILGIASSTFKAIRNRFIHGEKVMTPKLSRLGRRSVASMTALSWLQQHARKFAEKLPNSDRLHFPSCQTKTSIYLEMKEDLMNWNDEVVSFSHFLKLWREEMRHVVIPKASRFSKCNKCIEYKTNMALAKTELERNAVREKRYQHLKKQNLERAKYYKHQRKAKDQPERYISVIIDGMDQSKTALPHFWNASKYSANMWKLQVHLVGVIVHGIGIYGFFDLFEWSHSTNLTLTLLMEIFNMLKDSLPDTLYLQMDNCWKENKNQYMLAFFAYLVEQNIFKKVKVSFLMVGHTHENVDQVFSRMHCVKPLCEQAVGQWYIRNKGNFIPLACKEDALEDLSQQASQLDLDDVDEEIPPDSAEIYGDVLASVTEPLSLLFKKAHGLQVAFIGMLEKIDVPVPTQQDAEDLCYICQGLFEVCQIVTSLDLKLMCSVWKTISRFSTKHKDSVKDGLDVDSMVVYLCGEITNGYLHLFQLAPPLVDTQELSLSQGDSAAFQKSVKVLGYQMRIMMSLIDTFVDYISDCESHVVRLLILLQKNLPPCSKAPEIASQHTDEIKRQLLNATEPVVSTLVGNRKFMEYLTSADIDLEEDQWLPYLLLLVKVLDCLPKQNDDVNNKWISPAVYVGDLPRNGVLTAMFKSLEKCYVELCLQVGLSGVSCGGRLVRDVRLYEYVCTHTCSFVGSFPARHFHLLEETLLENLLSQSIFCAMLAIDVWCFLARFGSADLCFQQTNFLIDLWLDLGSPISNSILLLVGRLIKFLAPEHQVQLIKKYPPLENIALWCEMPLISLPSAAAKDIVEEIFARCVKNVHNFINKSEKVYKDLLELTMCLRSLNSLYRNQDLISKFLTPTHQQTLVDIVRELWNLVDLAGNEPFLEHYLTELLEISGFIVTELQNSDLLMIFQCICSRLDQSRDIVKLAVTRFLQKCGRRKFSPSAEQPQILTKIPQVFDKILCDDNAVIHTKAVESFTQFAESTPHETLVPECIGSKPFLQDIVVAYLNKTPYVSEGYIEEQYIQNQKQLTKENDSTPPISDSGKTQLNSPCQPVSKRKRLQEDEASDKVDEILTAIETSLQDLEHCDINGPFPLQSKERLKSICSRIQKILEVG